MADDAKTRLALIGAGGMLAAMMRQAAPPNFAICPLDLPDFDLTDREQVMLDLKAVRPRIIVNCAAYTDVDGCEANEELAMAVNGRGPGYLAEAAAELGATLLHISTDYIFDGRKGAPYIEADEPHPLCIYGRSKLAGEEAIRSSGLARYFIVRTSWLYGPGGKNFVATILRLASEREELHVVADQVGTPTCTADLARAIYQLLALEQMRPAAPGLYGVYHYSGEGACSWHEFADEIVTQARRLGHGMRARRVVPIATADYPLPARRPAYSVMGKSKVRMRIRQAIPGWRESLQSHLTQLFSESAHR